MKFKAGSLYRPLMFLALASILLAAMQYGAGSTAAKNALDGYGPASNPLPPPSPPPAARAEPSAAVAAGACAVSGDYLKSVISSLAPAGWVASEVSSTSLPLDNSDPYTDDLTFRQLQEFHCSDIFTRTFQRGQRLVLVKMYLFADPSGAFGTYTSLRKGASTVVTRGDGSSENDDSISFWQGNCYFSLFTTAEDDDEAKEMLRALADNIGQKIRAHAGQPQIMARLPRLDRVAGSERLIMGPLVARQVFPAPYLGVLSLEKSKSAALADYQFSAPYRERMKLLLIDYGNQALATTIYDKYLDNLGASHAVQDTGGLTLFKMSNTYLLCSLQGERLVIITGARKKTSPVMLARELY